ncbi:afadin isoform X3 [Hermetia illucens]|uniref:afadin isoform X3 n=1 Tax=Hermetia illucens TaxID=343691 RepID=UPI0018CC05E3|nr:afadin isoform X3 [Hermetia illucens]
MATHEKRMLDREAVRSVIQQWNANRLDLFALSEPDENLLFHGVMRFYFQDAGQKVATKCIRVASDATVSDVIETLIEKFRPDMRMLSLPNYALYEVHANGEERKLNPDEKPLLVQLNWHIDDREGRFLLRNIDQKSSQIETADTNFKRKLSKREKKEQKKREKLAKLNSDGGDSENHVAEKLYTELPETSFTRSISNPEAVMRRRRQQKLEKKLQQFRSKDGGPDTGGTLKIYGESLCRDVPYKTLLLSIRDCAQAVVREMLTKYGLDKADPLHYCLVQVNSDGTEYILDDDEYPLSILMNHPTSRGSIMFHVRRRPADSQPRRRKKKPLGVSNGSNSISSEREGPMLVEVTHSGDGGRRIKLSSDPVEVGSANTNTLQLFGPSIQARHCLISLLEGVCTVTPLHADALTFVNGHHIQQPTVLHNGSVVMFGRVASYRFIDSPSDGRYNLALSQSQLDSACLYERNPKMTVNNVNESQNGGQEPILPAVLEFPETHQETFLRQVITELDVNIPTFKLAPVYTLYLCARYRASTHYRPDLQPTERAHKLTIFLHHVANLIYNVVQDQYTDPRILAFWMANSSEFLHFLKSDRHISAFSVQAQEVLAESVQTAFRNLVNCFRVELSQTLNQFLSENIDHDSAAGLVLTVLGSAMALLRRCRVNAALTIQFFSQLFHYINVICFNTIVANSQMCTAEWGKVMSERLQLLELWAERQGLELAAECHLAKIHQCAQFLQAPKTTVENVQQLVCSCFRLNSLQMAALLQQEKIPRNLVDTVIRMAESVADELTRADGREVRLEESPELHLALLLPDDGFSCDVVRGIPSGLVDFLNPLQGAGMCRLAAQPTSVGLWTVYMHQFNQARSPSAMSNKLPQPEVQIIKLHKNSNGMGLSIVAAKGAGQERLGIYIKSVVPGGAADADGRLQAGDQLLRVDGQSLIGITQERAADYLVRTGPVVTLEVAKQGAIYHGLATLLQQPSPVIQRGNRRMSERDLSRMGTDTKTQTSAAPNQHLPNSKSVPALHHVGSLGMSNKSRSIHNLVNNNDQGFYQNLSVYRAQNQSHPSLGERPPIHNQQPATINVAGGPMSMPATTTNLSNQSTVLSRPISAYYNSNNTLTNTMPSSSSMSYITTTSQSTLNSNNINDNISNNNQPQYQTMQMNNRMKNNNGFLRDNQSQQSLRMNQMMAPSMPNIANSSGYASNISASQSMQNVNMISNNQPDFYHHSPYLGNNSNVLPPPEHQRLSANQAISHLRGQAKISEMSEMINRRNQRQEQTLTPMDLQAHNQLAGPGAMQHPNLMNSSLARQNMSMSSPQMQQMTPIKQLPPTAPKPHLGRHPQQPPYIPNSEESSPPLPPSTTHPLYKNSSLPSGGNINYIASSLDPPKVAYYPVNANQSQAGKNFVGANPWEREEREKEHELRREQIRHWRDQQIVELSVLPHRTPQQEEQLKTLVLERDFERRAQEVEDQEDEGEAPYTKENVQEVIRLSNQPIPTPVTNMKQIDIRSVPPPMAHTQHSPPASETSQSSPPMADAQQSFQGYPIQQSQIVPTPTVQPKSILKNNRYDGSNSNTPSSPSKSQKSAKFADDRRLQTDHSIAQLSKEIGSINLSPAETDSSYVKSVQSNSEMNDHKLQHPQHFQPKESPSDSYTQNNSLLTAPPPPPERNSSYVVMSQQQKYRSNNLLSTKPPISSPILDHPATAPKRPPLNNNSIANIQSATTTMTNNSNTQQMTMVTTSTVISSSNTNSIGRDGKRVSFHDDDNNFIPPQEFLGDKSDLDMIREDPNKFLEETTAILQSPTTPEGETWNTSIQQTPGVIGAQEVYRDPRQRRLQEQQQKQQQKSGDGVPEKLSFKEKMKMFALESGEDQTPKDKLKISRAQRDIDAVH